MKCKNVHGVYVRRRKCELLILSLCVNDLLITSNCKKRIEDFKVDLSKEFEMCELGNFSNFLEIEYYKCGRGLMMHQRRYASDILNIFEMEDCNSILTSTESRLQLTKDSNEDDVDST